MFRRVDAQAEVGKNRVFLFSGFMLNSVTNPAVLTRPALRESTTPCPFVMFAGEELLNPYHVCWIMFQIKEQGGFSGLLDADGRDRIELLQTYWNTMVLRDIIEAHPKEKISISVFSWFSQGPFFPRKTGPLGKQVVLQKKEATRAVAAIGADEVYGAIKKLLSKQEK